MDIRAVSHPQPHCVVSLIGRRPHTRITRTLRLNVSFHGRCSPKERKSARSKKWWVDDLSTSCSSSLGKASRRDKTLTFFRARQFFGIAAFRSIPTHDRPGA